MQHPKKAATTMTTTSQATNALAWSAVIIVVAWPLRRRGQVGQRVEVATLLLPVAVIEKS